MAVENISLGETIAGWLLDFDIDSHALKQEHKNWLNTAVLLPRARRFNYPRIWTVTPSGAFPIQPSVLQPPRAPIFRA